MYVILLLPSLQATDEKHRVHKRSSVTRLIKCVYIVAYLETKWVDIYPSSAVAVELWWCKSSDTHVYTCIHVHVYRSQQHKGILPEKCDQYPV